MIIQRHILNLIYLCPCLGLGQFLLYLCDLFFIFSPIFIVINHITPLSKQVSKLISLAKEFRIYKKCIFKTDVLAFCTFSIKPSIIFG